MGIEQIRAQQRSRQAQTIGQRSTQGVDRIGDRNPQSGIYRVNHPDGGVSSGSKEFSAKANPGDPVLRLPRKDGQASLLGKNAPPKTSDRRPSELVPHSCNGYLNGQIFNCGNPAETALYWEFRGQNGATWTLDEQPTDNPIPTKIQTIATATAVIRFEDAANCGGSNDKIQSGIAIARLRGDRPIQLKARTEGNVERMNTGYERIKVFVFPADQQVAIPESIPPNDYGSGNPIYQAQSTGENLECQMKLITGSISETIVYPNQSILIWSSTVDEVHHVGAYWRIDLELTRL